MYYYTYYMVMIPKTSQTNVNMLRNFCPSVFAPNHTDKSLHQKPLKPLYAIVKYLPGMVQTPIANNFSALKISAPVKYTYTYYVWDHKMSHFAPASMNPNVGVFMCIHFAVQARQSR